MSTEAALLAGPHARPDLRGDERGAIMVLGIFMCACMAGALWYLSGIGDAIVYRERMQEGADAVAFSGAVLHARGMNLIVLLNLIMALILAIRVALKALYLALMVIGTILSFIPVVGAGLAAPFFTAARIDDAILKALKQPIDQAITLLSNAQTLIAKVVPPASLVGSYQVGTRYKPIVEDSIAGSPTTVANGLPVEEDTPDHLCEKAGEAVGTIFASIIPIPGLGSGLASVAGDLAKAGGFYFCEIGSQGSAPNVNSGVGTASDEGCKEQEKQLQKKVDEAQKAYDDQCAAYKCTDSATKLTVDQEATLGRLSAQRDAAQEARDKFDNKKCKEDNAKKANDVVKQEMGKSSGGSGRGMTPKKMKANWKNGIKDAQVVSVATGNMQMLRAGETGARIGGLKTQVQIETPSTARYAIAQAEFFFDCDGAWTAKDCNGKPEESNAMWRLRWRARLRRFNNPFLNDGSLNVTDVLAGKDVYLAILNAPSEISVSPQNARLLTELAGIVLSRPELIIH